MRQVGHPVGKTYASKLEPLRFFIGQISAFVSKMSTCLFCVLTSKHRTRWSTEVEIV